MDANIVSNGAAAPESSAAPNGIATPSSSSNAVSSNANEAATAGTNGVSNASTAVAEDTVMTTVETAEAEPMAEVIEAQDASEPAAQSAAEPAAEPAVEPAAEPAAEPAPEPAAPAVEAPPTSPAWASLSKSFSWLDPHPTFLIVFVGGSGTPFAIQKDFLCAKSRFFYDYFYGAKKPDGITAGAGSAENGSSSNKATEHVVHLNDVSVEAFKYAQNFLYTGSVLPDTSGNDDGRKEDPAIPSYDLLVSIWKLGDTLGIDGLCERALEAMAENRRLTQSIPATGTLVQVWKDTPEGSSIRKLLLSWAAEYLRSSEGSRAEFAKALPQELLSELVVAMSSSYTDFWGLPSDANVDDNASNGAADLRSVDADIVGGSGKHYLEDDYEYGTQDGAEPSTNGTGSIHYRGSPPAPAVKRARYFDSYPAEPSTPALTASASNAAAAAVASPAGGLAGSTERKPGRTALPTNSSATPQQRVPPKKRYSNMDTGNFTVEQKLEFCEDLVSRMMTGPGFWTRLVGPFKEPVDPVSENIPDYFDKVKRPMDLGTIRQNLKDRKYKAPEEFLADMRQIFANVYVYWNKGDSIWTTCERLEKSFEDKYSHMNKWLSKKEDEVLM